MKRMLQSGTGVGPGRVLAIALSAMIAVSTACGDDGPFGRDDDVATVEFTSAPQTVEIGSTAQLAFEIRDADGDLIDPDDVTIDFSTSSATVATVSETGLVTPVAVGTAVITIEVGSVSDTITITVIAEISSVAIVATDLDLITGETHDLAVVVLNAQGNPVADPSLTFSSSDEAVVTIDDEGILTAEGAGSARIRAEGGGESDSVDVTVFAAASGGVSLSGNSFAVIVGDEVTINDLVVVRDAGGVIIPDAELAFEIFDETVVTIDAAGLLTGLSSGETLVTVTSPDATGSATFRLNVVLENLVLTFELVPETATIAVAGTVDLAADVETTAGDLIGEFLVVFSSSAEAVATVDPLTGVVTGVTAGTATITGTTGTLTAESVITVE